MTKKAAAQKKKQNVEDQKPEPVPTSAPTPIASIAIEQRAPSHILRFSHSTIAHIIDGQRVEEHGNDAPCSRCLACPDPRMRILDIFAVISLRLQIERGSTFSDAMADLEHVLAANGIGREQIDALVCRVRFDSGDVLLAVA